MAGVTNSWMGATLLEPPSPCSNPEPPSIFSNCALLFVVGVVLMMIRFEKKGTTHQ